MSERSPSTSQGKGFDRATLAARLRSLSPAKRALFEAQLAKRGIDVGSLIIPSRGEEREAYPLSFAQQRLWFIHQVNPASTAYHISTPRRIRGVRLDCDALSKAFYALAERHETLRTTFRQGAGGQPEQQVHSAWPGRAALVDLTALPLVGREGWARRLAAREVEQRFDLARGALLRATSIRLEATDHLLLLTMHHIVSDGWSLAILFRELLALYSSFAAAGAAAADLPELPIQYVDYAIWQRGWLVGEELERQVAYWSEALEGLAPLLPLPLDRPRPPVQRPDGGGVALIIPPSLFGRLRQLSRSARVTLFVTLLAAYKVVLRLRSGESDLAVGAPVAGRNRPEVAGLIGFFINTLVLRTDLSGDPTFRQLLARVQAVNEGANIHQDLPFEKLVEELAPERSLQHSPLFQASFAYQADPRLAAAAAGPGAAAPAGAGVEVTSQPVDREVVIFDLAVSLLEGPDRVTGSLSYKSDLFDQTTAQRIGRAFLRTLAAAAADPDAPISRLGGLSAGERHQLLVEWNAQVEDPPAPALTLHGLFAVQAQRTPDAVAMNFDFAGPASATGEINGHLSYAEFYRQATVVAARLAQIGVGPEAIVAVALDRSPRQLVAILGALMAGAAYLPLDPDYPPQRLATMMEDAWSKTPAEGDRILLTERARLTSGQLPDVEELGAVALSVEEVLDGQPGEAPLTPAPVLPDHPAYVIYTSGSTGKPKGVVISHRAAVGRIHWASLHDATQPFSYLNKTTVSFDVSVLEIFLPLAVGGRVVLIRPGGQMEVDYLLITIARQRLTHVAFAPSMYAVLQEHPRFAAVGRGMEVLYTSGEAVASSTATAMTERFGVEFVNRYGPTESTIGILSWRCSPGDGSPVVPIGRPIAAARVRVADRGFKALPMGVAGELVVGGPLLARGYLHRPGLTAQLFVPDPESGSPAVEAGQRLYRTGDLARFRADGAVEFLGRLDHQVKVRGFRIELGEVLAALNLHPALREVVVIDRREAGGAVHLVAYCVAHEGEEVPAPNDLRVFLATSLPEYMVPSYFVTLAEVPRAPSGKLDRRALPEPEATSTVRAVETLPRDEVETAVAAIWGEVLGLERIDVKEGFFDLGGHSLQLIRVQSQLGDAFPDRQPSMLELFRFTTVESLATLLRGGEAESSQQLSATQVAVGAGRAAQRRQRAREGNGDIAIIAMAGRFPGADTIEGFWRNLRQGVESIHFSDDVALRAAGISQATVDNPTFVPAQSRVEDIELFDAPLFRMSPREAQISDPQHRLLLECAWEALEQAGYDPDLFDDAIGVYAGVGLSRYWIGAYFVPGLLDAVGHLQVSLSNDKDFAPTRISYKLNLKGPSVNVNTACSTSLVTTHLACQALLAGECAMALSGGASITPDASPGYFYREGGIFSPDGHCRAFDAQAGGTVGGNGAAMVLLKRLDEALADGDTIHGVIKGTAINNDGSQKIGFTAPSVEGQAAVIAEALSVGGVEGETIGYIEAHGTATPLGDPIEIEALRAVFGEGPEKRIALGSVKTNLGHLGAAAGAAGLIKATLAVRHGEIPPSLHFERPNPRLRLDESAFYVSTQLAPWPRVHDGGPRRAGVSSFGLGGTNAHLVLEEPPAARSSGPPREFELLMLSAQNPEALRTLRSRLAAHLEARAEDGLAEFELADSLFTLAVGRKQLPRRWVAAVETVPERLDEAIALLRDTVHSKGNPEGDPKAVGGGFEGNAATDAGGRETVFLFPGQGSQRVGMGRALYAEGGIFAQVLDRCCDHLAPGLGVDLRTLLHPAASDEAAAAQRLRQTDLAQPALFVVCYALAEQWRGWGIEAAAAVGHSVGEYVAATLAGVFQLEDALDLVAERGRLMASMATGSMLSVPLSAEGVEPYLDDQLALAVINGPRRSVVSGGHDSIAALAAKLAGDEIESRPLHTSHAFHSPLMEGALEPLRERVARVELSPPRIPFLSNLTGTWIEADQATDPDYWARHMRQTVRFGDNLQALLDGPRRTLLEVGPGDTLTRLAQQAAKLQARQEPEREPWTAPILSSLPAARSDVAEFAHLLLTAGRLWLAGGPLDRAALFAGQERRRVPLPTYPFARVRYWLDSPSFAQLAAGQGRRSMERRSNLATWFYSPTWRLAPPPAVPSSKELTSWLASAPARPCWLILTDRLGIGLALARRLRGLDQEVVIAAPEEGRGAELPDDGVEPFAADSPAGYSGLLEGIAERGLRPAVIVHLLALDAARGEEGEHGETPLAAAQEAGLLSLARLSDGLIQFDGGEPVRLCVVTDRALAAEAGQRLRAERAPVHAALRVLAQERRNILASSVDLTLATPLEAEEIAATADLLLAETARREPGEVVAYRRGQRRIAGFDPLPLPAPASGAAVLRERGVYLLVGGLGRVGLTLARFLAERVRARLILTGRGALPPREGWRERLAAADGENPVVAKIEAILALEEAGAEVITLAAQVEDQGAMAAAIEAGESHFDAPIDGVLYLAGFTGSGAAGPSMRAPIETVDATYADLHFAPKAHGLAVLDRVLGDRPLDFCLLFSSLASVLGGLGYAAYAAANSYLDSYALRRTAAAGGVGWTSVCWDGWAWLPEGETPTGLAMSPAESCAAFERLLAMRGVPRVVVSTGDLEARLDRWVRFASPAPGEGAPVASAEIGADPGAEVSGGFERPAMTSDYEPPEGDQEERIAALWSELIGVDRIGRNDNFFELGGDSLLATQLVSRLRRTLKVEMPLPVFFAAPTIGGLAAAMGESQSRQGELSEVEKALAKIKGLSADEVTAQLESRLGTEGGN